jgi:hypothetical protein
LVEQAACAAAVHCTADEVRAQRLQGSDFLLRGCGQVWDAALAAAAEDGAPSVLGVGMRLGPAALEELQRWVGDWWTYCHPAGLRAHAALIRRASTRRRRLAELASEAAQVGRGESRALGTGGVAVEFTEQPANFGHPGQPGD